MCRKESLGLRHPLKSAIAAVLAVAMLVPTASAAPSVVLSNGTDGNAPTIAAADLVGNAEPEGIVDGSTIIISNYRQLTAIGTDVPVTDGDAAEDTFGTGRTISDEAGSPLTYALDATYRLAGTISMPQNGVWQLPAGFAGTFETPAIVADPGLYDQSTDTLYVHNVYQLAMLAQSDAADQPVMSNDAEPSTFGMGQPVMKADGRMLTYGGAANVALAMDFTTATPQGEADQITLNDAAAGSDPDTTSNDDAASPQAEGDENTEPVDPDGLDGRDYVGQVTKEIDGITYILIGNEQQLRAIGTGTRAHGRVYGYPPLGTPNQSGVVYPGDADLPANAALSGEKFTNSLFHNFCGQNAQGEPDENVTANPDFYYTADADYIIFRDIDLNTQVMGEPGDRLWTPLMFSGRMFGADGSGREKGYLGNLLSSLDAESTSVDTSTVAAPTISHVTVNQTRKMDSRAHSGIGFFGTVSSNVDTSDIGHSAGTAVVSNINLDHVSVTNASTETESTDTLISGLTDVLGDLLGGVLSGLSGTLSGLFKLLDVLLGWLPGVGDLLGTILKGLNDVQVGALGGLGDVLKGILDLRKNDPTTFATGAFAGRIVGDVNVNHCTVTDAKVENASAPGGADSAYVGMTGGFVGYMEGQAKYDGLSKILGATVDSLKALLNIIPGIGLGDLLELLSDQGNVAGLDKLVPVGYYNPVIDGCELTLSDNSIGTSDTTYAGGFVGLQIGSIIRNSSVSDRHALTVSAGEYAGGFAGLMRDAELEGLLQNLGVDLSLGAAKGLNPQSLTEGSSVSAPTLTVTAAKRAGGFAGAMAASYAVNSSVATDTKLNVSATESYAGGFAGQMTMGWATNLGVDGDDDNLLSTLSNTVKSILGSSDSNKGQLLTLAGFEPSAALGCGVSGGSVTVGAKVSYAGGFTGAGEGAVIAQSDAEHVSALTHWQNGGALAGATVEAHNVEISGLESVSAKSLAGGVAGEMETAAVGGLLNDTVGIGSLKDLAGGEFTAFEVSDAAVTGVDGGFTVAVTDYNAGGAIGLATGGKVSNVKVNNLGSVTGTGEVGGFIGQAAAGSTLGADGINLLGLVKFSGLLTVAQTTHLDVSGSSVNGVNDGFTVTANGKDNAAETDQFTAGGFYGRASSMNTTDSHVTNLKSVTAPNTNGMAGGFVGLSTTGGLAQIASDKDEGSSILKQLTENGLLDINDLLGAVPYMVPEYKVTYVAYVDGGSVTADIAGGYAGSFESGEVNKFDKGEDGLAAKAEASPWAVKNISKVNGKHYAGGFGGRVVSGSLAEAGGGLDLLGGFTSVNIGQLLSLVSAYMPVIDRAGVSADANPDTATASTTDGFTVSATKAREGIAGGYIGYGSGVQVSASDVKYLKHTTVKEPKKLEDRNADSYFDPNKSMYAVTGTQYAGGYIGEMNIGSTASAGESLSLLGEGIQLNDVLNVLDAVASTIKDSDVEGQAGGYAVLASDTSNTEDPLGDAGGFAGVVRGSRIENSDAHNFSHIIGQVSAGGYAGQAVPGDVASVLGDDTSILNGLVKTDNSLASLLQHFVPEILKSETTSIPCGGAVRAQAESDAKTLRGMAGGYIGHNVGGQIKGNVTGDGYSPKEAAAIRIRSVYGAEYAGGFTGLMEAGSTASTGSLGLLWGLVNVDNLLNALNVAYPTEENTAVYGPLAKLDMNTWNAWVDAVGVNGGYGSELADNKGKVTTQEELDAKLADVAYGMNVVAGRKTVAGKANVNPGGAAGGYVGAMVAGTITNGHAHDVKLVRGMRAAGGFAGMAEAGGAAELGSVSLFGESLNLNIDSLVGVANVFVPVIKSSTTAGYRTGMTVASPGLGSHDTDTTNGTGNAGGYIGLGSGVQIWGDGTDGTATPSCTASGLRRVRGAAYAGGFAGRLTAGTVVRAGTNNVSSGFLQQVIDTVLKGTGTQDLAQVLNATMSTVRGASVTPADEAWGFTVEGPASGDVKHPIAAGGFAGAIEATVLGARGQDATSASALTVTGLRGVDGGLYAGGFVGVATAGGVAQVNASPGEGASTTILGGLLKLGNIDAIQAFQPFIYGGSVTGVADGLQVRANSWDTGGLLSSKRMSGNAGGFAGTVMSGEVLNSKVESLNSVAAPNYAGGFVGYTGKSGIADVESLEALQLIGLTASIGDIMGTTVTDCSVAGIPAGYTVASQGVADLAPEDGSAADTTGSQKAGGFVGYADLAHITGGTATNLKLVRSPEAAGGFAGETTHAYLVNAEADSQLLEALVTIVNTLLHYLYVGDLENLDAIDINIPGIAELKVLKEGKALSVTLLGLKITVALVESEDDGTDLAKVTIGDSEIEIPCDKGGLINDADLKVYLIKGNSAQITNSKVTGIADGYDVFGGGATQDKNGEGDAGYAGGFVGHNDEGVLTGDEMLYADVVRGTKGKTGPFTGVTDYSSNWWFNSVDDVEHDNKYHVYRGVDLADAPVSGAQNMTVSPGAYDSGVPGSDDPATAGNAAWARFDVTGHKPEAGASNLDDWRDAQATPTKTEDEPDAGGETAEPQAPQPVDLGVYMEDGAKAVLMADTAVTDNTGGLTPEPGDGQDPCAQKVDVTVQKVWNDGHNADGKRPNSITVKLKATYTDESGVTHTPKTIQKIDADGNPSGEPIKNPITVTLSTADQSAWSDTWRKVVEDLPVAIDDSGVHYLTYTPTEVTVGEGEDAKPLGESGYTVSYTVDAHDRVITITNSTPLPETGGMGTHWFAILGILLVGVGILLTRKDTYGRGTGRHRAAR